MDSLQINMCDRFAPSNMNFLMLQREAIESSYAEIGSFSQSQNRRQKHEIRGCESSDFENDSNRSNEACFSHKKSYSIFAESTDLEYDDQISRSTKLIHCSTPKCYLKATRKRTCNASSNRLLPNSKKGNLKKFIPIPDNQSNSLLRKHEQSYESNDQENDAINDDFAINDSKKWTPQKDQLLLRLIQKYGKKWVFIREHFYPLSIHEIQARYFLISQNKVNNEIADDESI